MVGMTTAALYNYVDRVFVGRAIDENALAGVTVALPYMLILLAASMLVGFGGASLLSIKLGEKKHDEAERTLGSATFMMLVVAVVLTVGGLLSIDAIIGHGVTSDVHTYARQFLQIIILGTGFQVIGYGLNAMIRSEGNARTAMYTMLIGVLLNVILAYTFLFRFHWGIKGAALATVISQGVSALWVTLYFVTGQSHVKLRLANLWPDGSICRRILFIGSPMFVTQCVGACMVYTLNSQLAWYGALENPNGGDLAIAVFGSIYAFMMVILMPVFGVNQGTQPIVGYNFGAQNFDRVKKALIGGVTLASSITVVGFLIAMLIPGKVLGQFISADDPNRDKMLALGVHAIRICMMMLPLLGFQVIAASYFQAIGKPMWALVLMLSRSLIFLIPLLYILPLFWKLDGVWMAQPCADFGSSLVTGTRLLFELRHLRKRHDASVAVQNQPISEKASPVLERA
jgi:putative MATE family efflux protein